MDWNHLLSARRLGHVGAEEVTPARSPFQKDWDRIVFSSAFRRLQDKTQVHSLPASDYVRTRLTHSLEVSSVGRSLGAAVGENIVQRHKLRPGLSAAEFGHILAAACLTHDIGNPPFGHFGEETIRAWFAGPGRSLLEPLDPRQRADLLGFEGNAQGFRIVARLQNWRDTGGLRLTAATLASFAKYPFDSLAGQTKRKFGFFAAEADLFAEVAAETGLLPRAGGGWQRHPLAWLVEAADDICYRVVDLEDGYKLGRIAFAEAEPLLRQLVHRGPPRYREIDDEPRRIAYLRAKAIGQLIDDVAALFLDHEPSIMAGTFTGGVLAETRAWPVLEQVFALTRANVFQTVERIAREREGAQILTALLETTTSAFLAREQGGPLPPDFPEDVPADASRYDWLLAVTDYISGMTDTYAQASYRKLVEAGSTAGRTT